MDNHTNTWNEIYYDDNIVFPWIAKHIHVITLLVDPTAELSHQLSSASDIIK